MSEEQGQYGQSEPMVEPDISKDTEKIKAIWALMKQVESIYNSMTVEEQSRMSELSQFLIGD